MEDLQESGNAGQESFDDEVEKSHPAAVAELSSTAALYPPHFSSLNLLNNTSVASDSFSARKFGSRNQAPCTAVLIYNKTEVFVAFCVVSFWCINYYTVCVWHGFFLTTSELVGEEGMLDETDTWQLIFVSNLLLVALLPFGGYLGDILQARYTRMKRKITTADIRMERKMNLDDNIGSSAILAPSSTYGHRMVMCIGLLMTVLGVPFCYLCLTSGDLVQCCWAQGYLVLCSALFGGNMPFVLCEFFDESIRYTGVGISYNLANALVAGSTALVQTTLILQGLVFDNTKDYKEFTDTMERACSFGQKCWWGAAWNWIRGTLEYTVLREKEDSRLLPGTALQVVAVVAFLAVTMGAHICQRRQQYVRLHALANKNRSLSMPSMNAHRHSTSRAVYVQL